MKQDWGGIYWDWLTKSALPLWAQAGVDRAQGGFEELLGPDGRALAVPRRCRVQGRQSFVFAYAGTLGWNGPWRDVAGLGLDYLERCFKRSDGLYATLAGPDGGIIDQTAMTYDQAFAILASAALQARGLGPGEDYALGLLDRIEMLRRHAGGGFIEPGPRFLSNPHMHLFEAALAWVEAGGSNAWRLLVEEIVSLAMDRFLVGDTLREVFDTNWNPAAGEAGQVIEPGHQFEWAWLLERWARISGEKRAHAAALTLFATGRRGVDPVRRVAMDRTDARMVPVRATARLWPQTEWLKAACLLGGNEDVEAAAAALWRYLETSKAGQWRDKMREDGSFVEEPAPASSLYHIICAAASLKDYFLT